MTKDEMRIQIAEALLLGESFTVDKWNSTDTWSSVSDMARNGYFEIAHYGVRKITGEWIPERYRVTQKGKDLLS